MRTIAIINQKGGCGKTTTAINLSAILAMQGKRTLLVDMDPQSHCAAGLGVPEQRIEMDIGDAMLAAGVRPLDPPRLLWRASRNLDLAPSRMKLAGLEAARGGLAALPDKERRLLAVLHRLQHDYDVACIDCPPSIGLLTYNALTAADMVLIPVETSFFSLQGAMRQVNTVRTLARRFGVHLPVWLLATIHEETNAIAADLLDELHRRFGERVIPIVIRRDNRLREAASFGQSILDYAPQSPAADDYSRLGTWVSEHLQPRAAIDQSLDHAVSVLHADDPFSHDRHPQPDDEADDDLDDDSPSITQQTTPAREATTAAPGVPAAPEVKPVSRAEDVARRAQEFLRRIATGRNAAPVAGSQGPDQPAPAPQDATPLETSNAEEHLSLTPLRLIEPPPTTPVSPSAQRLLGARETSQGVLFVQPLSIGSRVGIAAGFNNWSPERHEFRRNDSLGVFELCVKLPPGKVYYRLVIDGVWSTDPYNDNCEPNPFGETNSFVIVSTPHVAAPPPAQCTEQIA